MGFYQEAAPVDRNELGFDDSRLLVLTGNNGLFTRVPVLQVIIPGLFLRHDNLQVLLGHRQAITVYDLTGDQGGFVVVAFNENNCTNFLIDATWIDGHGFFSELQASFIRLFTGVWLLEKQSDTYLVNHCDDHPLKE